MKRQLPKNVRQIGNVSDSSKIYIEDYVDTFFNQLCEKADQTLTGAFLVGEIVQEKEEDYIYVYGAIRMKEIVQKGKDIFINESTWKNACEICKQYFGDAEILGWFLATAGQAPEVNHNILKVHQKFFPREKSLFVVKEAREKEETYFIYKYKNLMECGGHYIYYEKNVEMQDYMIATRKKGQMTPSEMIEDTVTKKFRSVIRDKMEKNEQKGHSRYVYVLSTFLVLVVLVIGVTMMNNYDKIKDVQSSLTQMGKDTSDEDKAVETLGTLVSEDLENPDGEQPDADKEDKTDDKAGVPGADGTDHPDNTEGTGDANPAEGAGDANPAEGTGDVPGAENPTAQENPNAQENQEELYTVQKGDTLASISKKVYGDTGHVDAICRMNGLEDGNLIFIGQKLLLP